MTHQEAKQQLERFMGEHVLTFTVERDGDNWMATCNQFPAISTGGVGYDHDEMQNILKDAILTAAGVEGDADTLLRDASLQLGVGVAV